jgi:hypothetical protein
LDAHTGVPLHISVTPVVGQTCGFAQGSSVPYKNLVHTCVEVSTVAISSKEVILDFYFR